MKKLVLFLFIALSYIGFNAQAAAELSNVNYASGDTYNYSLTNGAVVFTYSSSVTIDNVSIILESGKKEAVTNTHVMDYGFGCTYYCEIASQIKELTKANTIAPGDKFKVQLEGVKDKTTLEAVGTDETNSVSLVTPNLPATFVSVSKPAGSDIKSVYIEGDEDAKITFTFSAPVKCGECKVAFGDVEAGTYGTIDVPVTYEGNTVIVDFTDINLNPDNIKGNKEVTLALRNITTADGVYIEGNIPGSMGSVGVTYKVKKVVAADIYGGFDTSENIDNVDYISCYVSEDINIKGIKLSYTLNAKPASIEIPLSQILKETDEDNGVYFKAPVSKLSFDAGTVTAELIGATTKSNISVEIDKAEYVSAGKVSPTECLVINPTPGVIENAPEEYQIYFNNTVTLESATMLIDGDELPIQFIGQYSVDNNKILLNNFRGDFYGEYTIKLQVKSGDSYYTYGDEADMMTLTYTVKANTFTCASITPAEGEVQTLSDFNLVFNEIEEGDMVGGFDSSKEITVTNEAGNVVATGTIDFDDVDYLAAVITLDSEITASGEYTLTIPEGTIYNAGYDDFEEDFGVSYGAKYNPELTFKYTIASSGVTNVSKEVKGNVKVYNTLGVLVGEGESSSVLKSLTPGLYIVNGEKVAIK